MDTLKRLKLYAEGGKVRKLLFGDVLTPEEEQEFAGAGMPRFKLNDIEQQNYETWQTADERVDDYKSILKNGRKAGSYGTNAETGLEMTRGDVRREIRDARRDRREAAGADGVGKGRMNAAMDSFEDTMSSPGAKMGMQAAVGAINMVDNLAMGDKNFGAQSEAIDGAVHAASGALMKSGNPYAMLAGVALEGANFLTKAGGQTVQGFDVDINSSGYGQMGHMESSSSRDFGAMIGLGGIFGQDKMKDKLAKRNAQAQMAMNAANIANEQSFEQEARANSIQNTIMNNNIALAGGLDTSLLGG